MWLLNARTFELKYYHSVAQAPHYAILSHTWEDEEVIFQDVRDLESARTKQGWLKIQYTCEQALRDDLAYCWVDTCCINKESSAELSEAINSMFNYYGGATICYVFLADVTQSLRLTDLMDLDPGLRDIMDTSRRGRRSGPEVAWNSSVTEQFKRFANARWWTRCFTLQELIAPPDLQFYNQEWLLIARKHDIGMLISARTGVDISVLRRTASPLDMTIAKRLSWAASRQATREEDVAYSLLGLLDINLPLLYGEGSRAFLRLQEELLRTKSDLSILAWKLSVPRAVAHGLFPFTQPALFAKSPGDFEECGSVEASSMEEQIHRLVLTSTVMEVDLPVISAGLRTKKPETDSKHQLADLGCTVHGSSVCLVLKPSVQTNVLHGRRRTHHTVCGALLVHPRDVRGATTVSLLVMRGNSLIRHEQSRTYAMQVSLNVPDADLIKPSLAVRVTDAYPREHWSLSSGTMLHVQRCNPYTDLTQRYVGGLTLADQNANQVHLIFLMLRDLDRTGYGLQYSRPDRNWASLVPDMALSLACESLYALTYTGEQAPIEGLGRLGHSTTLRHDFDSLAVEVAIESGRDRSLTINVTTRSLVERAFGRAGAADGQRLLSADSSAANILGQNAQPSAAGEVTKSFLRHWRTPSGHQMNK